MRFAQVCVFATGVAVITIGIYAETRNNPEATAVDKGVKWLVGVQGKDGGWGQDGGETSYVRQGERLESPANDVANTALAAQVLLRTGTTPIRGSYRQSLQRAVNYILQHVERSPMDGLAITDITGTQIQRKLGPYIDTFLTSKLLAELDGKMANAQDNVRVRRALEKCVAKIEKNQLKDGSWNISGGWAPILGTSLASQSLDMARAKGVAVAPKTLASVEQYTKMAASAPAPGGTGGGVGSGRGGGVVGGIVGGVPGGRADVFAPSAGVSLYKNAQELEQLSRTPEDRKKHSKEINAITSRLADRRFVEGFGSIGGEEFFSYLNISDSLRRAGGPEWEKWNRETKAKVLKIQNEDGTWAGHHCITGRVAVTSAAILTLVVDR
jgi:hypothetical protein